LGERQGVLATVARDGRPQLSNVLYAPDADSRIVRTSTTDDRVKARNLSERAAGDGIEGWDLGAPAEMWPEAEPASRVG
jgi:hypothetical protein